MESHLDKARNVADKFGHKAKHVADKLGHKAIDVAGGLGHKTKDVAGELGHRTREYWKSVLSGKRYEGSEIASPVQIAYAELLDVGMKLGLGALVVTFALYVLGIFEPHIALDDLPDYWRMSVHDYLETTHVPTGWGWLSLIHEGDFLNFVPIAFLSAVTIVCYLRILPMLLKQRDTVFSSIVVAEIVVLVLAASGILAGGH
jgi:hypothetical protein